MLENMQQWNLTGVNQKCIWVNRVIGLPCVIHPCHVWCHPLKGLQGLQGSVNGQREHFSRVHDDLKINPRGRRKGLPVQVGKDIDARHVPPAVLQQSIWENWRRQQDVVWKHVTPKAVTLVGAKLLLQQRQQLQPAVEQIKNITGKIS